MKMDLLIFGGRQAIGLFEVCTKTRRFGSRGEHARTVTYKGRTRQPARVFGSLDVCNFIGGRAVSSGWSARGNVYVLPGLCCLGVGVRKLNHPLICAIDAKKSST